MRWTTNRKQFRSARTRIVIWLLAGVAGLFLGTTTALAHSGPPPVPDNIWRTWTFDPWVMTFLILAALAYVTGLRKVWARAGRGRGIEYWQAAAASGGFLALAIALISPLDGLSTALFSAHMVQHMLLIAVAPVLLILSNARVAMLWSLPAAWRRSITAMADRTSLAGRLWNLIARPIPVLVAHSLVLWVWHAPALYNAAIRIEVIHVLEHYTMLATAMLFWWLVIQRGRQAGMNYGIGLLMVFGVVIQKTALGALITFSPSILYNEYAATTAAWGLTPVEDQQLAGAVMMGPWGVIYLVVGVVLFARWLRAIERSTERNEQLRMMPATSGTQTNRSAKEHS